MNSKFGLVLKQWRQLRRMSQLDLGLSANVSARHISFLETGRSRPSRSMVLILCEELDIPLPARNQLLTAAGLAPAYENRGLAADEMKPAEAAVGWMLERHDPFPAMAMDRHWTLLQLNRSGQRLLSSFGLGQGDSLLDAFLDSPQLQSSLLNLSEVALHIRARLRTESAYQGGDHVLDAAADRLSGLISDEQTILQYGTEGTLPAFVPTTYSFAGMKLSLFSTMTQFGTAEDIALSELKIEMLFPADDETRNILMALDTSH